MFIIKCHSAVQIYEIHIFIISMFIIIQQIVTMPIYGKEALNICHPT